MESLRLQSGWHFKNKVYFKIYFEMSVVSIWQNTLETANYAEILLAAACSAWLLYAAFSKRVALLAAVT